MKNKDLNNYFFPNDEIKILRKIHFNDIINFIGKNQFTVDTNCSSDERVKLQNKLEIKIQNYLKTNNLQELFMKAYHLTILPLLSEMLLQSLAVHIYLNYNNLEDVFLSPQSILYFENEYPSNIICWKKNKKLNILDECKFYENLNLFI